MSCIRKQVQTPQVSLFADGGYFYDAADGRKYYGADIGKVVRNYSLAFPDLRRDIHSLYFATTLSSSSCR